MVKAEVSCDIDDLGENGTEFTKKFYQALQIAQIEPYRAVTHNKGVMNGIDAVVLATGNDFRAVEAGVHAYASRNGKYSSLTHAKVENGIFTFWIEIPLALGTVGGLTGLHPLVKLCCFAKFDNNRNSRRPYENAFDEYIKSISCNRRRKNCHCGAF